MSPEKSTDKWRYILVAGFVLAVLGILEFGADLMLNVRILGGVAWLCIMMGVVLMIIASLRFNRKARTDDERTWRARAFASYWTMIIVLVVIWALWALQYLSLVVLDETPVLLILTFTIIVPFMGLTAYYNRKGDIQ